MKSNYRQIGDFIRLVDERNRGLEVTTLLGLSINKVFIPSVANTIGSDMANYKIIRKGQFACSIMQVRRDKKIPVALLQEFDEAIISQAYPVFEVIDRNELDPEYLMMWMTRSEFDRHACFLAVGGVRGSLEWEDFLEMPIPVPSPEKQRAIVKEYNTVVNRIKLNEQLNQKLEETAQALYKHWFVDFEFPFDLRHPEADCQSEALEDKTIDHSKGYKSSGGPMVYNEELGKEIPEGWEPLPFTKFFELKGGGTPDTSNPENWNGEIPFFTPGDIAKSYYVFETEKSISFEGFSNCSSRLYEKNTVFVTARGTVGAIGIAGRPMAMNQSCYAILSKNESFQCFTHQHTINAIQKLKGEAVGAVFTALVTRDFDSCKIIKPNESVISAYEQTSIGIYSLIESKTKKNQMLENLKSLILSKMTQVEVEEKEVVV